MVRTVKIQDNDVTELLKTLDKKARNFDSAKYGLPVKNKGTFTPHHSLVLAVYEWLDKKKHSIPIQIKWIDNLKQEMDNFKFDFNKGEKND